MGHKKQSEDLNQLGWGQLEIYAKELREHFYEERRLRQALAIRHEKLEKRLREIATIEKLSQTIYQQNQLLSRARLIDAGSDGQVDASGRVVSGISPELSIDNVLQHVVDLSREMVHARYAVLIVLQDGLASSFITSGLSLEEGQAMRAYLMNKGIQGTLNQQVRPMLIDNNARGQQGPSSCSQFINIAYLMGIPVVYEGQHIGNLYLANTHSESRFSQEDVSLMDMFATQTAVAIENAWLCQGIQAQAILEERDRIGKDLHDHTIQSLYAIGLNLDNCIDHVVEAPAEVKERLEFAVDKLNEVISDTRNFISELKPERWSPDQFEKRLKDLVLAYGSYGAWEVAVDWDVQGDFTLSSRQASHLLSIAREGLTNTIKHAVASKVVLGLSIQNETLKLWILDDGDGIDTTLQVNSSQHGLSNMKQRAEAMGGEFSIGNNPRHGTLMEVVIPLQPRVTHLT